MVLAGKCLTWYGYLVCLLDGKDRLSNALSDSDGKSSTLEVLIILRNMEMNV